MLTKLINGQKKLDYINIGAISKKKNMKSRRLISGMNIPRKTNFDIFHLPDGGDKAGNAGERV